MRIAILVLAIFGSLIAFGMAACATTCASCTGAVAVGASERAKEMKKNPDGKKYSDQMTKTSDSLKDKTTSFALGAIGFGLMGIMGLVGGILGFIKLGKGEHAKLGGGLLVGGIMLCIILNIIAHGGSSVIASIVWGGEFLGIAAILAFVAKPGDPQTEAAQAYPQQQVPPGQYPQQQPQDQQPPQA